MGGCCGGEENGSNMNTKAGKKQPAARPKNSTAGPAAGGAR